MRRSPLFLVPLGLVSFAVAFVLTSLTACEPCANYCGDFVGEILPGTYAVRHSPELEVDRVEIQDRLVTLHLGSGEEVVYRMTATELE